jgi:hypothetical protein
MRKIKIYKNVLKTSDMDLKHGPRLKRYSYVGEENFEEDAWISN